jgi:hypothetical protein
MLKIATTFRGRCPKHPSYNPATDTAAELDNDCRCCVALAAIHAAYQQLLKTIREFPERHRHYGAAPRSRAGDAGTHSQLALFALNRDSDTEDFNET